MKVNLAANTRYLPAFADHGPRAAFLANPYQALTEIGLPIISACDAVRYQVFPRTEIIISHTNARGNLIFRLPGGGDTRHPPYNYCRFDGEVTQGSRPKYIIPSTWTIMPTRAAVHWTWPSWSHKVQVAAQPWYLLAVEVRGLCCPCRQCGVRPIRCPGWCCHSHRIDEWIQSGNLLELSLNFRPVPHLFQSP